MKEELAKMPKGSNRFNTPMGSDPSGTSPYRTAIDGMDDTNEYDDFGTGGGGVDMSNYFSK